MHCQRSRAQSRNRRKLLGYYLVPLRIVGRILLESRCLRLRLSEHSFPGNQGVKTLQVLRPPFLLDRSLRSIQSISHSEITCRIHVLSDTFQTHPKLLSNKLVIDTPRISFTLFSQRGANMVCIQLAHPFQPSTAPFRPVL